MDVELHGVELHGVELHRSRCSLASIECAWPEVRTAEACIAYVCTARNPSQMAFETDVLAASPDSVKTFLSRDLHLRLFGALT